MADTPEMPDLKKVQENKPAGFAWAPVAKAAASAAGRTQAPPPKGRGKVAAAVGLLVVGGLVFAYAAFRFAGTTDGGVGGGKLGGVASSMKIRFARQNDPTGFIKRESASAAGEKMRFDLIKAAADKEAAGKAAGGTGAPGAEGEEGAPMAYDEGPASRASGAVGGGAGGPAGRGLDDQSGGGGLAGGGAPRLNASGSSIRFQGMRRVSGTAGFRSIQGGRGAASRTIRTQGSSANPFGTASGGGSSGGTALSGGKASGATGVSPGRTAGDAAGAGSAAAGGGGGGGAPGVDMDALESTVDTPGQIRNLLVDAGKLHEQAEDEKKKAQILQAGTHTAQAAYHYDLYRKKKSAAKEKEAEAARLSSEMENAAGSIIEQPATAP